MIDTTTLSGYLLDYYVALAEEQPSPCLRKHPRSDDYICIIGEVAPGETRYYLAAYSPTTNPALALPIMNKLIHHGFQFGLMGAEDGDTFVRVYSMRLNVFADSDRSLEEAALRALVAWKFPDGLPKPIYESEK